MGSQSITVTANNDDGFWQSSNFTNNSILNVVGSNGADTHAFFRFQLTSAILTGSTITQADLKLTAVDTNSAALQYDAKFDKVANSSQPSSFTDMNGRTYTAGTTFTDPATTGGSVFTHSIVDELQELVDTNSLASGDWVTVVLISQASASTNRRWVCLDNGSGGEADLVMAWDDPPIQITATIAASFSAAGFAGVTKSFTATVSAVFTTGGGELWQLVLRNNPAGDTWESAISFAGSGVDLLNNGDTYSIPFTSGSFATFKTELETDLDADLGVGAATVTRVTLANYGEAFNIEFTSRANQVTPSITASVEPFSFTGTFPEAELKIIRDGGTAMATVTRAVDAAPAAVFDVAAMAGVTRNFEATSAVVFDVLGFPSLLFNVTATASVVFNCEDASLDVFRPATATMATVFTTSAPALGTITPVDAAVSVSFTTSTPTSITYCQLFARAQTVFYSSAHPDFITPLNSTIHTAFNTTSPELQFTRLMTAAVTTVFNTEGHVRVSRPFTATAAAVFTVAGSAHQPVPVTASIAAAFTLGTPLAATARAFTSTVATVFVTGSPTAKAQFTATVAAVFTTAGNPALTTRHTSTIATSFTPSGFINVKKAVSATVPGVFTVAAVAGYVLPVTSTMAATFLVTGSESFKRTFTATVAGTFATNSPLMKVGLRVTSTVVASFNLPSPLANTYKEFTSTIAGSFTAQAVPGVLRNFSAVISLDVLPVGTISLTRLLTATTALTFSAAGTITNRRQLTANPAGSFQTAAALDVFRAFSAHIDPRFIVSHHPLVVNPLELKDVWKLPPRDWVFVMAGLDE